MNERNRRAAEMGCSFRNNVFKDICGSSVQNRNICLFFYFFIFDHKERSFSVTEVPNYSDWPNNGQVIS